MDCILCQVFSAMGNADVPVPACASEGASPFPEPVLFGNQAPGNRAPVLTDADYRRRSGAPSAAARRYERPVTVTGPIGPTDERQPMPRSAVEAGHLRAVRLQYTLVGGPACTAENSPGWGWIHNYGYMTIADTLKPAQQLPQYNRAAVDTDTILDRARASVMRTFYGGR